MHFVLFTIAAFLEVLIIQSNALALQPLSRSKRLVGGEESKIEDFPYLVYIDSFEYFCGGAIISPKYIITAAHCLQGQSPSSLRVRAGSSLWYQGGSLHQVRNYTVHEDFRVNTKYAKSSMDASSESDLAIVLLEEPIVLDNETKRSIAMFESGEKIKPGSIGVVSGWGQLDSGRNAPVPDQLRSLRMTVLGKKACFESLRHIEAFQEDSEICAVTFTQETKGLCYGDSGSPLVVDGKLAGVVAHGGNEPLCGTEYGKYPDVFTEIAHFRNWIDEKISELNEVR